MTPTLTIVIPTHNRRQRLLSTLHTLARQTTTPDRFEVVVAADGCTDNTAAAVRGTPWPFALRVVEQPASGAAAARNQGAAQARGALVLFLDDDIEAEPQLVEAHLRAHEALPGGVVLGCFRPSLLGQTDDLLAVHVNLWWGQRFAEMARPAHRFTFQDLFAGNVSMPRALLEAAGGFHAGFKGLAGEDYELGIRLLQRRARFQFSREAAGIHHDAPTLSRVVARARGEGGGHVVIVRTHPEAFAALPLRHLLGHPLPFGLRPWLRALAARLSLPRLLAGPMHAASTLKLRRLWQAGLHVLHSAAYWQGAIDAAGSLTTLRQLAQEAPLHPERIMEQELDTEAYLSRLDEVLAGAPMDTLRLRYGRTPLGRIPPVACAEALRAVHVRDVLVHWYGYTLLSVQRRRELRALLPAEARP